MSCVHYYRATLLLGPIRGSRTRLSVSVKLTLIQPSSHIINLLDLFQLPIQESRNQSFIIKGKLDHVFPFLKASPCSKPQGFPDSSADKESACNAGDPGSIPVLGRSPGEGMGYPHQYS